MKLKEKSKDAGQNWMPVSLTRHIDQLTDEQYSTPHEVILQQLLEKIQPIDYQARAFPHSVELREQLLNPEITAAQAKAIEKSIEDMKVNQKHYIVITIQEVIDKAIKHNWGLCKNNDFVYAYNGTFWAECVREEFQRFLGDAAMRMTAPPIDCQYYQFKDHLYKQFLAAGYLAAPVTNKDKVLINLANGTFEVSKDGIKMKNFDPLDFITYQLPFAYDPNAAAPLWQKFLDEVLPDVERQQVLAEYLGSIFIKNGGSNPKLEKALILYGTGGNGKSVVYEVIRALLGFHNICFYSLQSLTNETGYFRAKLANKLLNYASEINGKLQTDIFKQLASGEPVDARLPYGQPFTLEQYAKMIFNCNELPKDVEHTDAFYRRFLIIPFDVTIPEDRQDKQLHNKIIKNELSGVFNWILEGLNRVLHQHGFSKCDAAKRALEEYKLESNSIRQFLAEGGYEARPDEYTSLADLYASYKNFCWLDGMPAFKKVNFSKQLIGLGFRKERKSGGIFFNISK